MVYRMIDPFSALRDFQNALDSTRRSDWLARSTSGAGAFPAVNVFQQKDDYIVVAELPGIKKTDIDVTVKDGQVRIRGKKEVAYDENVSVHRRERNSGSFDRTLSVPFKIDADRIAAEYRDGVLAVHLPRAEADKPRSVTIS